MLPSITLWKLPIVVAGARILHALIGMQKVVADLRAEAGFGLLLVFAGLLGFPFFFLHPGQPGASILAPWPDSCAGSAHSGIARRCRWESA